MLGSVHDADDAVQGTLVRAWRALEQFLRLEDNRPLHADPFAGNTGSVRLLEKVGFRRAGSEWHGEHEHIMLVLDEDRR